MTDCNDPTPGTSTLEPFSGPCGTPAGSAAAADAIRLRGVRVHNLKGIDLDLPHRKLLVVCGVSGSGKSSLALDTLFAEGQRRYIESFSAYARQFLLRLEKPAADSITGIPPSIAVTRKVSIRSNRATVGTVTEIHDYLRLLFARVGQVHCPRCGDQLYSTSPEAVAECLSGLSRQVRVLVTFRLAESELAEQPGWVDVLRDEGFIRVVVQGRICRLDEAGVWEGCDTDSAAGSTYVVVDRVTGGMAHERLVDSLETSLTHGGGRAHLWIERSASADGDALASLRQLGTPVAEHLDERNWDRVALGSRLICERCRLACAPPEPQLFNFNSPLGACPACEGFGKTLERDMELIVPDPQKTIREGAIAPWNTPAYRHELDELLALAGQYGIPVDVPFSQLNDRQRRIIEQGVPERHFGGLNGFFAWLERHKYKVHVRVFLSRWRSARICPDCSGQRLRPEALAVRLGGCSMAEICSWRIDRAFPFFQRLALTERQRQIGRVALEQVLARLRLLLDVGLCYLSLDRPYHTLSGGEAQRVALTSTLGSSLVQMLYVLDEPTAGLHPVDTKRVLCAIEALRDRGNTVVVVEHDEQFLGAADQLIELGPEAGDAGGRVVFQGTPREMLASAKSLTADYLTGRRGVLPARRRPTDHGWLELRGAHGNNLQRLTARFPLGVLCLVTGVSGSGKSTLVQETLYPALCRRKRKEGPKPLPYEELTGAGQVDDVVLIDPTPISRSPRSNPATYIKAFDPIRQVFAETLEARTHNYSAGHFSFNVDDGCCSTCKGDGYLQVDMQFLADVYITCHECGGRRYRKPILEVRYRGKDIAQVLDMSIRQAFHFFRGQAKVQQRLKLLLDVGLDYLRLGQPANTLSTGEAQRLKLASYLARARRKRTLFLLDEPTTGLHFSDVVRLIDCFDQLLAAGHSLIVIEHNTQLMRAADWLIDLGPGAGEEGGRIVAEGTPEQIIEVAESQTGACVRGTLPCAPIADDA